MREYIGRAIRRNYPPTDSQSRPTQINNRHPTITALNENNWVFESHLGKFDARAEDRINALGKPKCARSCLMLNPAWSAAKAAWDSHKRASASWDKPALIQIFAEDIGHVQRLRGVGNLGTVLLNDCRNL